MKTIDYFILFLWFCIAGWATMTETGRIERKVNILLSRTASTQQQDPNFSDVLKEKDRQILHWRQICLTLEKRNAELAKEFQK